MTVVDALNDLGKVAGGVFGWNDAECCACGRRDTADMSVEHLAGIDIRRDGDLLSHFEDADLILLEVCVDPEPLGWNDTQQIAAVRRKGAHSCRLLPT